MRSNIWLAAINRTRGPEMHRILTLDQQLTSLFADIEDIANDLALPLICLLSDEETIRKQTYPGIYRIDVYTGGTATDVSAWIETFRSEWEQDDFKKKSTPNLKKKRILQHQQLPEWMPLYLGKSKNVGARVLDHINLELEKTTYALKLAARPGMVNRIFRLHTLELRVQNYDLIVPVLEAALRNRFNPLIGRQ